MQENVEQKIIVINADKDGLNELIILELQGTLEIEDKELKNLKIGNISFNNGKVFLIIGNHKLNGSKVMLEKPIAVMKKRKTNNVTYNVLGLIKQKFVFNTRPSLFFNN